MADEATPPASNWSNAPREFWIIAYIVLAIFAVIMLSILVGCVLLLRREISTQNAAALAAVAGLVGAIAGYAASNTQTVLSTIYGGTLTAAHAQRTVNTAGPTTINEVAPKVE
jgi:hypothetical protein